MDIDKVLLNFNQESLQLLNVILGLIMFGIALDLRVRDFKNVMRSPKAPIIGLITQLVVLPALTFGLAVLIAPTPSIGLGMILIAACPGGNVSNFITHLAKGSTELSVSMTAVCNVAILFTLPLNLTFWAGLHAPFAKVLTRVELDPWSLIVTIFLVLGLPLVLGMFAAEKFPNFAAKARKPFKIFSLVFFVVFIGIALSNNISHFLSHIHMVFFVVLIHNSSALALGYFTATVTRLSRRQRRAISIEVGIQNSGLGLVLIFEFFQGLGGMAMVAAWWGIWHILAGLSLAFLWTRFGSLEGEEGSGATSSL